MSTEPEKFRAWAAVGHPLDWFTKACGEPLPNKYRLPVWFFAEKAWLVRAEQADRDLAILRSNYKALAMDVLGMENMSQTELAELRERCRGIVA